MENIIEPAKLKAATTYNAAADHFDDGPLAFWDRYGQRTIERLRLKSGSVVLDVGCGSGASAIPAGKVVGPAWTWRTGCSRWHGRKPPDRNCKILSFAKPTWKLLAIRMHHSTRW